MNTASRLRDTVTAFPNTKRAGALLPIPGNCSHSPNAALSSSARHGTISSYDYEQVIQVKTKAQPEAHEVPVDEIAAPFQNPIQYLIHTLETVEPVTGYFVLVSRKLMQQIS